MFRGFWERASLEDRIVFVRFITGVVYGFIAYLLYKISFTLFFDTSTTIWFIAGVAYIITMIFVEKKFKAHGWFLVLIRGLLTYYLTWIIVILVLHDLFG